MGSEWKVRSDRRDGCVKFQCTRCWVSGSATEKVKTIDDEWRKQLTPEQYNVTREQGTEQAFTGETWDNHEKGIYQCICCGNDPCRHADARQYYRPCGDPAVILGRGRTCRAPMMASAHRSRAARTKGARRSRCPRVSACAWVEWREAGPSS